VQRAAGCGIAGLTRARAPQLTISTSRVGMGVTGGVPYGFDLGTKAGTPGGPFIEGINQGVVGMQVGGQRKIIGVSRGLAAAAARV